MSVRPPRWSVVAYNTASQSQNKIHDDAVAQQYGFRGGLVPGVDDYAYLAHVPVEHWGLQWIECGTMSARFHHPVYEGQRVEVRPGATTVADGFESFTMELVDPDGTVCATATAAIPLDEPAAPTRRPATPLQEPPVPAPAASAATLAAGTTFDLPVRRFDAGEQVGYLADVRETLPHYAEARVAHPGWLLRLANRVLGVNVTLGPWIHVSSAVRHHALVRDGDDIGARARVTEEWERKGHRFVTLDVELVVVDGPDETVVTTIAHTAIHTPRHTSELSA